MESGSIEAFAPVEAQLSLLLPMDYKQLICGYGSGSWQEFLWVLNPFSRNKYLNLVEQSRRLLEAERIIRGDWPDLVPFALYPEEGGLFPWGITDNGDRLFWRTEGEPGSWPIIVFESRGPEYECHQLSCCDFLREWLRGELIVSVFPDDTDAGRYQAFTSVA